MMKKLSSLLVFSSIVILVFVIGLIFYPVGVQAGVPANDDCANNIPIFDGDTAFSTIGATTDGPAHIGCEVAGDGGQTYQDIWYTYNATCTGELIVSTCNQADYDTDLVIYDGTSCNGGDLLTNFLECNDDFGPPCAGFSSELTALVVTGQDYLVRVGGWNAGDEGNGTLTIGCIPIICGDGILATGEECDDGNLIDGDGCESDCTFTPQPNSECDDAIGPLAVDSVTSGTTNGGGFDDVGFCGTSNTTDGVWYTVIGTGNTMTASTCNDGNPATGSTNYDTKISVFCASCDFQVCVDGLDDSAGCAGFSTKLSFPTQAGAEYLILVHGFGSSTGDFDLAILDDSAPATGAVACINNDVGSEACRLVQLTCFDAIEDGEPFRNHGALVRTCSNIVKPLVGNSFLTPECSSCMINQIARRVPIGEQEACGSTLCPCFDASDIEGQGIDFDAETLLPVPECIDQPGLADLGGLRPGEFFWEAGATDNSCTFVDLENSINTGLVPLFPEQGAVCRDIVLNSQMWNLNCSGDDDDDAFQ